MNRTESMAKQIEEALLKFAGDDVKVHAINLSDIDGKAHSVDDIEKLLKGILGKGTEQENGMPEELARLLKETGVTIDEVKAKADEEIAFMEEIVKVSSKFDKDPTELLESMAGFTYAMYCGGKKFTTQQGTEFLYKSKVLSSKLVDILSNSTNMHNGDEMIITLLGAIKEIVDSAKKQECKHASASKIKNRDKEDKINELLQQLSKTLAS